ncbi:MAG TPA: metal-dependent transcriptional regulator [Cryomorphaceae bacterium]|nr:metal-dependent transcriptional regulator [Cryomorphaceae bacterium]
MNSQIEENYLKAIYKISQEVNAPVSTSNLAEEMGVQSASVTDMIKKLSNKRLLSYRKYHGVSLSDKGRNEAVRIIRKHRLWETFLVEKLGFGWGEVHDVAEQLEHVRSEQLVDSLDAFLDFPRVDPHGDPIPDKDGVVRKQTNVPLTTLNPGDVGVISAVKHDGKELLDYLDRHNLVLGHKLQVIEKLDFDGSMEVIVSGQKQYVSQKISQNILVKK